MTLLPENIRTVMRETLPPSKWNDPERYLKMMGSEWARTLVRAQSSLTTSTVLFWAEHGAHAIHLPVTTGSVSSPMGLGSDSLPVAIDLLGAPTYLADSMQFLLEYGVRIAEEGCYYIMPSFRGETPDESHLCQFFHSEAELPIGLDQLIPVVEKYVCRLAKDLIENYADDILAVAGNLDHLHALVEGRQQFSRISHKDACELLKNAPQFVTLNSAPGGQWRTLSRAGEQALMLECGPFVWVTDHDHLAVPFYQAFGASDATAINADLLFGVGEVVGAGQRHLGPQSIRRALQLHQVREGDYSWYIAMHKKMPILTSGFGLGVERFLMWGLQHMDIRNLQLLTRINGKTHNP